MIGIAFGYPSEFEQTNYGIPYEVRFARIETGSPMDMADGRRVEHFWRRWELPLEERNKMAEEILKAVAYRPREISGFTLFYQSAVYTKADGSKTDGPGFQMSVRRKGEEGWDVTIIPEEQAMVVFRLLENSGHPDGPWKLNDGDRVSAKDSYIVPQSAVEGWPKPKLIEVPDDGDVFDPIVDATVGYEKCSFLALLEAAAKAREGLTASMARLVGAVE